MTSYKVRFFKNLVNSDGHPFKCLQQTIEISRARSVARAVRAAERRYARFHRVLDWKLYADTFEVEIGGDKFDYRLPHAAHGRAKFPDVAYGLHRRTPA
jgi:hypothetical protein